MRTWLPSLALLAACAEPAIDLVDTSDDASLPSDLAAPPHACVTPPAGMVGWWTFDELGGPSAGDTAGVTVNNGTWMNGPVVVPGQVASALRFDGVDDHVLVGDDPELDFAGVSGGGAATDNLTIDAWIRTEPGAGGGVRVIVDKRDMVGGARGYSLYTYNGRLAFQMADAAAPGAGCGTGVAFPCTNWSSSSLIPNDGAWHLVAVTVSRAARMARPSGRFYIDGAPAGTFSPRAGSMDNTSPLTIGVRSTALGGGAFFRGDIDEVEVFKRALAPAEIASLYAAGPAGKCKETCDGTDDDYDGQIDEGYPDSDGDGVADCVDPRECVEPPPSMTAWWTLDEPGGGISADNEGAFADDGAWSGPVPTAGQVDGALQFDGVNDAVIVPHSTDIDFAGTPGARYEDLSIDAWVRLPRGGGQGLQVLLDKRISVGGSPVGYSVYLYNGRLGFQMADAAAPGGGCGTGAGFPCTNWTVGTADAIPADGRWHLIAITVDRPPVGVSTGLLYVDGYPAASFTPRPGSIANTGPLTMGVRSAALGGGSYFGGGLDEVEVFKRVLDPIEVLELYGAGPLGKCKEIAEVCNGVDDNGDGVIDEGYPDTDGDGTADCVDAEECDCLDNDGDGAVDEGPIDTDGDGVPDIDRCEYGVTFFGAADDAFDAWLDNAGTPLVSGTGGWSVPAGVSFLTTAGTHMVSVEARDLYTAAAGFVGYVQTPWVTLPTGSGLWEQTNVNPGLGWQNSYHPGWPADVASTNTGNCANYLPIFYAAPSLAPLYAQGAQWVWQNDCSPNYRTNWLQVQFEVCPQAACPTAAIGIPCE